MNDFGSRVKAYRELLGLTQRQLAERAGIEKGAVYRAEVGKVSPQLDTCVRLARGLGCTVSELLGDGEAGTIGEVNKLLAAALRDMEKLDNCEICAYNYNGKCERPKGKQGAQCFLWRGLNCGDYGRRQGD